MKKLRLMSNNVWWCDVNTEIWEAKGADCSAKARMPQLARMYKDLMPDVLGLQECSGRMLHFLMAEMTEMGLPYAMLWGKDTPIIYRRDKYELVDSRVGIYPEQIPGLEGSFNNLRTKCFCIAVLRDREDGQVFIFASTHLWYKSDARQPGSEAAKAWQMDSLIDCLDALQEKYGCGAVVVGDLNTWYVGKAVQTALARGFVHGHDVATDHADETTGMHFCGPEGYDGILEEGGFGRSIDHILVRGMKGTVRRYERCFPEYYAPLSDHYPLWIDVEV